AVEGQYHIEAVAISSGSYIIRVDAEDGEHGVSLASTSATGTAVPGVIIGPVSLEVPNPDLETPTRRRSVRH
ncbi:MAG TPA: hypothetical protein VFV49_01025, partial [Thermoanaerobaculia bacterium]|nr:hypothetical protein [Thermoanaerobaculia bacterium]